MPAQRGEIGQRRWNHAGNSVGPPTVDLHKGNHRDVRQRQPHRAQLREPRPVAIEDAARNVQMGNGVAIVEHAPRCRQLHTTAASEAAAQQASTAQPLARARDGLLSQGESTRGRD